MRQRAMSGGVGLDHQPMAVAREFLAYAVPFLCSGRNLRLYGIPVWTGRLPKDLGQVSFVIYGDRTRPELQQFITYLFGPQASRPLQN